MKLHYFPPAALWLFLCSTHVSAIHKMAQYPSFKQQFGLLDRQEIECPVATETLCPTGNGCCPSGAPCFTSNGVPLCSQHCPIAAVTCSINGIVACCELGQECSPEGCIVGGPGPGPTVTPPGAATTPSYLPLTTPTPPGAAATSFGCSTDNPCYQGTFTWCCQTSQECDFSSPGSCLETITQPSNANTDTITSAKSSTTTTTSHAVASALAVPNVLVEGIFMKLWTCFAAMGVALGL